VLCEGFKACEIVYGKKVIDRWQGSLHPSRQGKIVGGTKERVQPNEAMTRPLKALHFCVQVHGLASIPTV
jgi:hypothetical protein